MDDAGSLDCKKQDFKVAQSEKDDSTTGPLQKHQFELPVDYNDVETFPASPHDTDVMHKTRGVDVTETCGTTIFQKNRPKIRSNLTWRIEHVFGQSTCQKAVQKTKQAARGDDRTGTRSVEAHALRKPINRLFLRC